MQPAALVFIILILYILELNLVYMGQLEVAEDLKILLFFSVIRQL